MEFTIDRIENLMVTDEELSGLLHEVYVKAGYTIPETAQSVFALKTVKNRGALFVAKEMKQNVLA